MDFQQFMNEYVLSGFTERQMNLCLWRTKDIFGFGENEKTLQEIAFIENIHKKTVYARIANTKRKLANKLVTMSNRIKEPIVVIKYTEKKPQVENLPIVYKPIEALGDMSVRATNALKCEGILVVEQLVTRTHAEILKIPNLGRKTHKEINVLLEQNGLKLGMEISPESPV